MKITLDQWGLSYWNSQSHFDEKLEKMWETISSSGYNWILG